MHEEQHDELPLERDPVIASALRESAGGQPPVDDVAWTSLHARLVASAEDALRARRREGFARVLARWAMPMLPGATAASVLLVLLLAIVIERPESSAVAGDAVMETTAAFDVQERLAAEDPTVAGVLEGDDQVLLEAAIAREE